MLHLKALIVYLIGYLDHRDLTGGGTMIRPCLLTGMALATLVLGGCLNAQHPDLSQWRPYRPAMAEDSSRRIKSAAPRQTPRETLAR